MKTQTYIHWSNCLHPSVDQDGYCTRCRSARWFIKPSRFDIPAPLKRLERALRRSQPHGLSPAPCSCHADSEKFKEFEKLPGFVACDCPEHGLEATRLRDAWACVGATR
jgi:hypothetical protein